jgi:hypothetical protein
MQRTARKERQAKNGKQRTASKERQAKNGKQYHYGRGERNAELN